MCSEMHPLNRTKTIEPLIFAVTNKLIDDFP